MRWDRELVILYKQCIFLQRARLGTERTKIGFGMTSPYFVERQFTDAFQLHTCRLYDSNLLPVFGFTAEQRDLAEPSYVILTSDIFSPRFAFERTTSWIGLDASPQTLSRAVCPSSSLAHHQAETRRNVSEDTIEKVVGLADASRRPRGSRHSTHRKYGTKTVALNLILPNRPKNHRD